MSDYYMDYIRVVLRTFKELILGHCLKKKNPYIGMWTFKKIAAAIVFQISVPDFPESL